MAANAENAQRESTVAPPNDSTTDDVKEQPNQDTNAVLLNTSTVLQVQNSQQDTAATPQQFPVSTEPNPPPLVQNDGNYRPAGYIFSDGEESSGDDWSSNDEETLSDYEHWRF
jgi:hypothetical protein